MTNSCTIPRATACEKSEFCIKCAATIEDTVVAGMLSSKELQQAMTDEMFFIALRELVRNHFELNPF